MNHDVADDFIVSTMETHSVREMCEVVFSYLDMNYKDYVTQNPKYLRPEELPYLKGDSTKIREATKWKPEYSFIELMHEMCDHWMRVPLSVVLRLGLKDGIPAVQSVSMPKLSVYICILKKPASPQ